MSIPFVRDVEFEYGVVDQISPLIRRVICNNPGGFTFHGTGTYIVGQGEVAVIDPGPLDDDHIAALERAVEGETVTHILITHTHRDHSPAAAPLRSRPERRPMATAPMAATAAGRRSKKAAITNSCRIRRSRTGT